ncbi:solute carrier family 23 protein, partial [Pseudomonas aeruginosa]
MSVVTDRRIPDSPVDQRLPLTQLLLVGFQHVLLMYGGAVAVPLIVGQAAGLSREEIAFLINADLLVAGIATMLPTAAKLAPIITGMRMPIGPMPSDWTR